MRYLSLILEVIPPSTCINELFETCDRKLATLQHNNQATHDAHTPSFASMSLNGSLIPLPVKPSHQGVLPRDT